jgi:tRNA 2-selenouridine synthase
MIRATADLSPGARDAFSTIIDVRSPSEFAADHVPGAINLPVLDDAERAEVGTLYVQTSRFLARRMGAAKVARNIARHLEGALADRPKDFRPLIYCWRGGMRSNAMATVLGQVGWHTAVLEGGYRTWRRQVVARLHAAEPVAYRICLVDGPTGAGKTALLGALSALGEQAIDLEALAGHRGSLFGATAKGQPGQKLFESLLMDRLDRADPARPLFLEAESSRIGNLAIPQALWPAMAAAPRVRLEAELPVRVRHILDHYGWIAADRAALLAAIERLPSHHSKARKAEWAALAEAGALEPLVAGLIAEHYDPAYARSMARRGGGVLGTIRLSGEAELGEAARAAVGLAARIGAHGPA